MARFWFWLTVTLLQVLVPAWAADEEAEEAEEEEAGEEEEAPAKDCPKPEQVTVGVYLNNVQSLDLKDHTYELDAYVWYRWCDPEMDPSLTMEIVNASELWGHMPTPLYDEPEELEDGTLYQVIHLIGRFSSKMPLHNYPFDVQHVQMVIEDGRHPASELVYVSDASQPPTASEHFVLPGYLVGQVGLTVDEHVYPTAFGDPRATTREPYSRATVSVPLTRPLISQLVKLFVPLLSVVVCAALMFLLSPSWVDSRVGVGTTAMLTIVALQMTYNQDLPDVGYLMLMDKVYLVSYVYVLLGLVVVVRATALVEKGELDAARRLHRLGLGGTALLYVIAVAALVQQASVG
jgi:hypothetical protein